MQRLLKSCRAWRIRSIDCKKFDSNINVNYFGLGMKNFKIFPSFSGRINDLKSNLKMINQVSTFRISRKCELYSRFDNNYDTLL